MSTLLLVFANFLIINFELKIREDFNLFNFYTPQSKFLVIAQGKAFCQSSQVANGQRVHFSCEPRVIKGKLLNIRVSRKKLK